MNSRWCARKTLSPWFLIFAFLIPLALQARMNDVMGKLQFDGRSNVEKDSGVWVDGQYVGYLKELKGSKSVLLLPGEHRVTVRQDGYADFTQTVQIQPGKTMVIPVIMRKASMGTLPPVLSTVKVNVNPSRAAVFVDGLYVGHVREFDGMGRGLLVAPGNHQIKIALPGYQTFQTEIQPAALQTVEIKTNLLKSANPLSAPLVNSKANTSASPAGNREAVTADRR